MLRKLFSVSAWRRYVGAKWLHARNWLLVQPLCWRAWSRLSGSLRSYRELTPAELRNTRRSDTVFIFGSGASLNALSSEEFRRFEQHDTMAFNWFAHQNWVRIDFYLLKEVTPPHPFNRRPFYWYREMKRLGLLLSRPFYRSTVFILQKGWMALDANRLLAHRFLPAGARLFRFWTRSRGIYAPPIEELGALTHGPGTLAAALNFAYQMGWSTVVLVGVDLYDRRYFWLRPDETRLQDAMVNATHEDMHPTTRRMIEYLRRWQPMFEAKGVRVFVYNPRSLLKALYPIYDASGQPRAAAGSGGLA